MTVRYQMTKNHLLKEEEVETEEEVIAEDY